MLSKISIPYLVFFVQIVTSYLFSNSTKFIQYLEYRVISTDLSRFQDVSKVRKNGAPFLLKIQTSPNDTLEISFQLRNIEVINWKTDFHVYEEKGENHINIRDENFEVVKGFVTSQENSSSVVGYLEKTLFYGTITMRNIVYYIEDLKQHPEIYNKYINSNYNALIYKDNASSFPPNFNSPKEMEILEDRINFIKMPDEKELFRRIIGKGKVCTLFILVDNLFLKRIHNNDVRSATIQILNSVETANSLFRSTDFDEDGYPDNIGFLIKHFVVLQSEKTPMNLLPLYRGEPIEGSTYINRFSRYSLLNEVCLGVAFTGHTFNDNVLGISYTAEPTDKVYKFSLGGICDRPHRYQPGKNLNTLAISPILKNGNIVPQYIFDLSLAHELGHSFGSDHDSEDACKGYLMTAHTPPDSQRKRFIFSSCSKQLIMRTIVSKGHCFESYEDPFCGNGIVEKGEDCDCGTIRDCESFDMCCGSQGQENHCKVNTHLGYKCHPSQGICCTATCTYKNLLKYNLDCKHFTDKCPCRGKTKTCPCGVDGKCTGNTCHSDECARILLKECECPTSIRNNKCRTCCIYNNNCFPSINATEQMMKKDKSLLMELKQIENGLRNKGSSDKYGFYRTFSDNNVSVELYFREVTSDDYCLLFGQVGICGGDFKCYIPSFRHVYPSLRAQSGSPKFEISKLVIVLEIYLLVLAYYFT